MNKLVQKAACIALLAALMGGCSMNDKKDANTKTNETKEAAEKSVKDAKNKTEDSIDNVMNYFKDKGPRRSPILTLRLMRAEALITTEAPGICIA